MGSKSESSVPRNFVSRRILFFLWVVFLLFVPSSAQRRSNPSPEALPEELQVPLFLKILTYDRSLETKVKDTIRIGVLYFPKDDQSKKNRDAILENLKLNQDKTINGVPFSFTAIELSAEEKKDEMVRGINVLYVTSDGSNMIKEILQISRARKILTITGRVDYVNFGVSVGLGVKEEKPQIVINLSSVRAEGSDFSANLLRLCKVIS